MKTFFFLSLRIGFIHLNDNNVSNFMLFLDGIVNAYKMCQSRI
jgi:hypothetical protein